MSGPEADRNTLCRTAISDITDRQRADEEIVRLNRDLQRGWRSCRRSSRPCPSGWRLLRIPKGATSAAIRPTNGWSAWGRVASCPRGPAPAKYRCLMQDASWP